MINVQSKILVTGASGFIGSKLLEGLTSMNYDVSGISASGGTKVEPIDLLDINLLENYWGYNQFDTVFHLAATLPRDNGMNAKCMMQNFKMTKNVIETARKNSTKKFIYASGTSVYGTPLHIPVTENNRIILNSFYIASKFLGELLCWLYKKEYGLNTVSLRISAPYGPGLKKITVIKKFITNAMKSEDIIINGTGSRSQDFTYIEDVLQSLIKVWKSGSSGIFNIGSGETTSMSNLATVVLNIVKDSKSRIIYSGIDPQEDYRMLVSSEKAKVAFGYKPKFDIKKGITQYIKELHKN